MEQYKKHGFAGGAVGNVITLILGVGVATLILIFVGSLGGQVWEMVEPDIDAITNETIRTSIRDSAISGFGALDTTASYLPIIVLAVVIALVLALVLTFGGMGGGNSGGSAL